jgi:chaperonin GroES
MGKERPEMGQVIAIGPGRQSEFGHYIRVNAKVGDIVLVPKIGTIRIEFEGDEYYITQDREILATVKEKTELVN